MGNQNPYIEEEDNTMEHNIGITSNLVNLHIYRSTSKDPNIERLYVYFTISITNGIQNNRSALENGKYGFWDQK
jgi:hypothetical protein